jgi:hypothetical protein
MKLRFRQAQKDARRRQVGLWSNLPAGARCQRLPHGRPTGLPACRFEFAILRAAAAHAPRPVAFRFASALDRETASWPPKRNPFPPVTTRSRLI